MKKSTLSLCYVIMSEDGKFWLKVNTWGDPQGNDMYDAKIFKARHKAEKFSTDLNKPTTVFEIGLYNEKPVMLVDAYEYYVNAKFSS